MVLVEEDRPLDPMWQRLRHMVAHMLPGRHGKHVIQLLERALLRLRDPEEYHNERKDIKTAVEAKRTRRCESVEDARPGEAEDGGPEEAGGDGPGHADFAVGEWKDFRRVGEGDWALAGGVKGGEEHDEEGDDAEMGGLVRGDVEREAGCEERPRHLGEGEEEEGAPAEGVNGPVNMLVSER